MGFGLVLRARQVASPSTVVRYEPWAKVWAAELSNSKPTTGSSPTTQASCPGSIT